MGTGGGREADKLHSMEKPIPSTLVGYRDRHWPEKSAQNFRSGVLGNFQNGYGFRTYSPTPTFPDYPPPLALRA
jgi:hypothetical protein